MNVILIFAFCLVVSARDVDEGEEKKTLSQQVADGKYGLIQTELFSTPIGRPGIISYDKNTDIPNDNEHNFGGLGTNEIWLAQDHLLVLKGGQFHRTASETPWPPIDDYQAPNRQVKIPAQPKVPPPFPVQLTEGGPLLHFLAINTTGTSQSTFPIIQPPPPPPPPYTATAVHQNPTNITAGRTPFQIPAYFKPENYPEGNGYTTPPPFPIPPPPLNQSDDDDPSIYYPPPYSFYYQKDNSSKVAAGPLVPGIVLPPPPDFFQLLQPPTTTTTTTTTTARIPSNYYLPLHYRHNTTMKKNFTTTYYRPHESHPNILKGPKKNLQKILYDQFNNKQIATPSSIMLPPPPPPPTKSQIQIIYNNRKPIRLLHWTTSTTTSKPPIVLRVPNGRTYISSTTVPLKSYFSNNNVDVDINSVHLQPQAEYYFYKEEDDDDVTVTPTTTTTQQPSTNFQQHIQHLQQEIHRYLKPNHHRQAKPIYEFSFQAANYKPTTTTTTKSPHYVTVYSDEEEKPNANLFNDNNNNNNKYLTIFGQKLRSGGGRQPSSTFISYPLPGQGAHFYFLTPQFVGQERGRRNDRALYTSV